MSDVCKMFEIGPIDAIAALEYDGGALVNEIAEYRLAEMATSLMNAKGKDQKKQAGETFRENPALAHTLARMARAQRGEPLNRRREQMGSEGNAIWKNARQGDAEDG